MTMSENGKASREPEEDPKEIATGSTLADISIRNHVFAWMLMAGLILFGLICFTGFGGVVKGLGISQNPDVDSPVVNIRLSWEGAAPVTYDEALDRQLVEAQRTLYAGDKLCKPV